MNAAQETLTSAVPDLGDIPLGDPLEVTGDDYARDHAPYRPRRG